jgi:stage V sporulation protein B
MRLLKIFSISLLSQGTILIIGFINGIIITRNLGVDGRGKYAIAMGIIVALGLLFGEGLYYSNTYLVSIKKNKLSQLFTNGKIAVLALSGLMVLLALLFYKLLINTVLPGITGQLFLLAVFSVTPLILLRSVAGLLLGLQKYYSYNLFLAAPFILYILLNVGFLLFSSLSPELVLLNYLISMSCVALIASFWLYSKEKIQLKANWEIGKESISKGLKSSASQICLFLLFRVDIFLVNYFLGVRKAGLYSIAVVVTELLQKTANTLGTVIFPKLSGKSLKEGRKLSLSVLLFVLVVGIVFSLFMVLFGVQIISLLYTKDFVEAATPLYILLPGAIIMSCGRIILSALWGQDFPRVTIIVPIISFFLNVILNLIFIPKLGMNGAALSTTISYAFFGIILTYYYFRFDVTKPPSEIVEIVPVD